MTEKLSRGDVGSSWNLRMLVSGLVALLSVLVAGAFWLAVREKPVPELVIATGPQDGAYYRIGARIKKAIEGNGRELAKTVWVEESSGSDENAKRLRAEEVSAPIVVLAQADSEFPAGARILVHLYEEILYIVARPKNTAFLRPLTPAWFTSKPKKRIFLGEEYSGTRRMATCVLAFFGVEEEQIETVEGMKRGEAVAALEGGELDAAVLLDTYPSQEVERLIKSGGVIISLGDPNLSHNEAVALSLRYPSYRPFVLPRQAYREQGAVQTLSVSAALFARDDLPDWIAREITRRLYKNRAVLSKPQPGIDDQPIPALRGLRERFDPASEVVPFHDGAESYYRRNEPSFVGEHAETFSFLLGVAGIVSSTVVFLRQRFSLRKKNRIDQYYLDVEEISGLARGADLAALVELRERLDAVHKRAFDDLVHEKVEANESFIIFQQFIQGQLSAIDAKLHLLDFVNH